MGHKHSVGVDAHIDPANGTVFTAIFGEFDGAQWGDVGIAPYANLEDFRKYVRRTLRATYGRSFCQSLRRKRNVMSRSSVYRTARRPPPKMRLAMHRSAHAPAAM